MFHACRSFAVTRRWRFSMALWFAIILTYASSLCPSVAAEAADGGRADVRVVAYRVLPFEGFSYSNGALMVSWSRTVHIEDAQLVRGFTDPLSLRAEEPVAVELETLAATGERIDIVGHATFPDGSRAAFLTPVFDPDCPSEIPTPEGGCNPRADAMCEVRFGDLSFSCDDGVLRCTVCPCSHSPHYYVIWGDDYWDKPRVVVIFPACD